MKTFMQHSTLSLGVVLLGTIMTAPARASCAIDDFANVTASAWLQQQAIPYSDQQGKALGLARSSSDVAAATGTDSSARSIVGLWKFTFVSKGTAGIPNGTVLDAGFVTWHGDGTEITNSSRPPRSGNFCMGIYKQTGTATYKLNHVGLSWDPTGVAFVGPANIREIVTLDHSGNHYAGTFTIDQYAEDGTTLLAHISGTQTATRITAD